MQKNLLVIILLLVVGLLGSALVGCGSQEVHLAAYTGDGMRVPMLKIKEIYEQQNPHVVIDYSFSGSGSLEKTMRSLKQGDLFMPGDTKYIKNMEQDELIVTSYPVALHVPAMIVHRDSAVVITWEDMAKEGVRFGMPNPDTASSGRVADRIIAKSPLDQEIRANITLLTTDVGDTIGALLDDKVDVVISWQSAAVIDPDRLMVIDIPSEINEIQEIWIAVPTYTTAQDEATAFAEFVAGSEGRQVFKDMGFEVIEK